MSCATHPDRESTGYCRNCGKALCAECTRNVRGVLYCESCLAGLVSQPPPIPHVEAPSPALAAGLGFIPGLGAVYNGEYVKGLVQIAVFAGIIAILNSPTSDSLQVFFAIGLGCFYFYLPIDSYRTAKLKQRQAYTRYYTAPAASATAPPEAGPQAAAPHSASFAEPAGAYAAAPPPAPAAGQAPARNSLAGAVVLIALGLLILMANLGLLAGDWFGRTWPLILIGFGIWLLWKRYHEPAGKGGQPS